MTRVWAPGSIAGNPVYPQRPKPGAAFQETIPGLGGRYFQTQIISNQPACVFGYRLWYPTQKKAGSAASLPSPYSTGSESGRPHQRHPNSPFSSTNWIEFHGNHSQLTNQPPDFVLPPYPVWAMCLMRP